MFIVSASAAWSTLCSAETARMRSRTSRGPIGRSSVWSRRITRDTSNFSRSPPTRARSAAIVSALIENALGMDPPPPRACSTRPGSGLVAALRRAGRRVGGELEAGAATHEHSAALAALAEDGDALETPPPRRDVDLADELRAGGSGEVDRLRDGVVDAALERLLHGEVRLRGDVGRRREEALDPLRDARDAARRAALAQLGRELVAPGALPAQRGLEAGVRLRQALPVEHVAHEGEREVGLDPAQIGRASCRERV